MNLTNVKKLKSIHFKAICCINEKECQICNLCDIDHAVDVITAFHESKSSLLSRNYGYWTFYSCQCLTSKVFDQVFDESRLPRVRRTYDCNNKRRRFYWSSVHGRHVSSLLNNVLSPTHLLLSPVDVRDCKGFGVPLSGIFFLWNFFGSLCLLLLGFPSSLWRSMRFLFAIFNVHLEV